MSRHNRRRHSDNIRSDAIRAAWEAFEEAEPDISTERLIAMTMDKCGVEIDDVLAVMCQDKGAE